MEVKSETVVKYNIELTAEEYSAMCSLMEAIDRNGDVKLIIEDYVEDRFNIVAKNAKDVLIIREPIQRQIPPNSSWEFIEWAEEMDVEVLDKFIHKTQEQIVKEEPLYSNDRIFFKKIAWIVLFGSFLSAMFLTSFPMVSGFLYIFSILSAFIGWAVL